MRGEEKVEETTEQETQTVSEVIDQYHPAHYRAWADSIRERNGWESILTRWLDDLADALEDDSRP